MNASKSTLAQQQESARRLEALVRRASAFVARQLGQLDDLGLQMAAELRHAPSAEAQPDLEHADWLRQKAEDERRIEEQLDHLAEAWKQLESEQRRLMMLGQTPQDQAASMPSAAVPEMPEARADTDTGAATPQPLRVPRSRDLIDATAPQDAAAAALQFQKLKREIRQQNRRQR